MTTCREVIQSAYRRSGILAMGINMNETQAVVGLELLIGMYQNLLVGGMFGPTCDVVYDGTSAYVAKEGTRVYNQNGAVITLPDLVKDECNGGMRQPRDGAFITVVDPATHTNEQHIYDRSTGQWSALSSLALMSEAPLTGRWDDHMKNMLAVRLLGESGQPTPLELTRAEGRARLALSTRRDGERVTGRGEYS